jgi:hypothetical protein
LLAISVFVIPTLSELTNACCVMSKLAEPVPKYKLLIMAEIELSVEKVPLFAAMYIDEILDAVIDPELKVLTLTYAGTTKGTFVKREPSPTNLEYTVPAESVEIKA